MIYLSSTKLVLVCTYPTFYLFNMPAFEIELQKLAALSCIEMNEQSAAQFTQDIRLIMDFVEQLRQVDTTSILPLCHPLDLHQRLRSDKVTEKNCISALEKIAPEFADGLYLVPKVLESEK